MLSFPDLPSNLSIQHALGAQRGLRIGGVYSLGVTRFMRAGKNLMVDLGF